MQIQNGCDHRCTFCIIPFGRGNSRSLPARDVIDQVRPLVETGLAEVVLTGVDITSYRAADGSGLGALVKRILAEVPELGTLNRRQAAKLAGVAPLIHQSGKSEQRRKPRGGRKSCSRRLCPGMPLRRRHRG